MPPQTSKGKRRGRGRIQTLKKSRGVLLDGEYVKI